MSEPITNVEAAVAVLGALPVPQGPEPQLSEAQSLRDSLREACDEIARLESELGSATARVAELEAERQQWRRTAHHLAGEAGLVPKAPRDDDPFGLHHTYRVGRDLPEAGGAR